MSFQITAVQMEPQWSRQRSDEMSVLTEAERTAAIGRYLKESTRRVGRFVPLSMTRAGVQHTGLLASRRADGPGEVDWLLLGREGTGRLAIPGCKVRAMEVEMDDDETEDGQEMPVETRRFDGTINLANWIRTADGLQYANLSGHCEIIPTEAVLGFRAKSGVGWWVSVSGETQRYLTPGSEVRCIQEHPLAASVGNDTLRVP